MTDVPSPETGIVDVLSLATQLSQITVGHGVAVETAEKESAEFGQEVTVLRQVLEQLEYFLEGEGLRERAYEKTTVLSQMNNACEQYLRSLLIKFGSDLETQSPTWKPKRGNITWPFEAKQTLEATEKLHLWAQTYQLSLSTEGCALLSQTATAANNILMDRPELLQKLVAETASIASGTASDSERNTAVADNDSIPKENIEQIRVLLQGLTKHSSLVAGSISPKQPDSIHYSKAECLRALSFRPAGSRKQNIEEAHQQTCDWVFSTEMFQKWESREDLSSYNGVLWIKGKPGAGKSTILKHVFSKRCETKEWLTFFFTACGNTLEHSATGMYRSLVLQLIEKDPQSFGRFLPIFSNKRLRHDEINFEAGELKDFILSEIEQHRDKPLVLLIDALDECDEGEVQDVVSFLEMLSITAISSNSDLSILLSSRNYPHISMKSHLQLTVDTHQEHAMNIKRYIQEILSKPDREIVESLLQKASGVFMWVVLVVKMVNKAYEERGDIESMRSKLNEIPSDLENLFSELLGSPSQETILILQWALFSIEEMTPEQLYFAVKSERSFEDAELLPWDKSTRTPDMIEQFINDCSHGPLETRHARHRNSVNFIHETVRDFLLRNKRLQRLDMTLVTSPVGRSHVRLTDCCRLQILQFPMEDIPSDESKVYPFLESYPFLEYAMRFVFHHIEKAHCGGVSQETAILELRFNCGWFAKYRGLLSIQSVQSWYELEKHDTDLLQTVCLKELGEIVKIMLSKKMTDPNATGGEYCTALQAAVARKNEDIAEMLLRAGADVNIQCGDFGNALQAASHRCCVQIVEMLLQAGADVNAQGGFQGNALQAASFGGSIRIVKMLLQAGADVNAQGGHQGNALQAASYKGFVRIAEMLLQAGADMNARGGYFGNALQAASYSSSIRIVEMLLQAGADVNAQGGHYGNALQAASCKHSIRIIEMLLQAGADVNAQGGVYGNALQIACWGGSIQIVEMLLQTGAGVNVHGGYYESPLHAAKTSPFRNERVIELLVQAEAHETAKGRQLAILPSRL